jgi:hypothetical protein
LHATVPDYTVPFVPPFGWLKTIDGFRKTKHCGRDLVEWFLILTATRLQSRSNPKILATVA